MSLPTNVPVLSDPFSSDNNSQQDPHRSRILSQNAEAGPSSPTSTRTRTSITFNTDAFSPGSPTSRDRAGSANATGTGTDHRSPGLAPVPPALVSRRSDPIIIYRPPPVPLPLDPVDPLDATCGFEPLSPVLFHDSHGGPFDGPGGGRSGSGKSSSQGPEMAQRLDAFRAPMIVSYDQAGRRGTYMQATSAPVTGGGSGPLRNHAPWVRKPDAQPTS